jgi:hypothetical protein
MASYSLGRLFGLRSSKADSSPDPGAITTGQGDRGIGQCRQVRIESWAQFREIFEGPDYKSWAFRGHSNERWGLHSSLSRYLLRSRVQPRYWVQQEERILRIFRRKAHLYLTVVPEPRDSFQWLSLMQHHGAPTRLIDFTWSPYVAAFYALAEAETETDAAIWALHPPALGREAERTIRPSQKYGHKEIAPWVVGNYERYFLPGTKRIVVIGEPHHMNRRLISHSGTFVTPGVIDIPVDQIVLESRSSQSLVKFTLSTAKIRREAIRALYSMNITYATLFPDLDGLSRSLALELETHWAFDPVTGEATPHFRQD